MSRLRASTMSTYQSYRLLEDGQPAGQEDLEEDVSLEKLGKGRRRFLQSVQTVKDIIAYTRERLQESREKIPFSDFWTCAIMSAVVLVAFFIVLVVINASGGSADPEDILQYIDPLIGTGPGGHVFPGATLPFGMAKAGVDVTEENHAGYTHNGSPIMGFSSLHDSGTGGASSLGNFPLFVHPSCPDIMTSCKLNKEDRPVKPVTDSVFAKPGYFTIDLVSGVKAEMTAGDRATLFKFTFTNATDLENPVILADASDLPGSQGARSLFVDPETGRITASGRFKPSFGIGGYNAYMCADFRGAEVQDVGTFNKSIWPGETQTARKDSIMGSTHGVYTRFKELPPGSTIFVRVGLSWLSIDRACDNAEREIADFDFERLVAQAQTAWREKFKPITLDSTGVDKSHLRNFWSGVYRAFINPQDYTGENQLWNSTEPYYDSWYCIWDTFRGVHPFYLLVDTVSQSRMVRSLIDVYKRAGWLPDCRMSFCKGYTQGGSNADVILVDSWIKKLEGVDWNDAYAALIKDAEEQPPNWNVEGRGGLKSWKELGYIPYLDKDLGGLRTRSVSRTVEVRDNDSSTFTLSAC